MARSRKLTSSSLRNTARATRSQTNTRHRPAKVSRPGASGAQNRSQETLTQIDFVRIFPSVNKEDDRQEEEQGIGDGEGEDSEFVPLSRKKRKRRSPNVPCKRQQTLTQIDWTPRILADSDEEGSGLPDDIHTAPSPPEDALNQLDHARGEISKGSTSQMNSCNVSASSKKSTAQHKTMKYQISGMDGESSGCAKTCAPTTPKTVRVQKVPSSQTPMPSPLLTQSTRHSRRYMTRSPTRSPLGEVSSNSRYAGAQTSSDNLLKKDSSPRIADELSNVLNAPQETAGLITKSDDFWDEEKVTPPRLTHDILELHGREINEVENQVQDSAKKRTDSEAIASQINHEMLYYTQQPDQGDEHSQNEMDFCERSQIIDSVENNELESASEFHGILRPSQVSTVDVTHDESSSPSRHLSSLPSLEPSTPQNTKLWRQSVRATSPPNEHGSPMPRQKTITLSQLLPDSLMDFSLPAPPDSSQIRHIPSSL